MIIESLDVLIFSDMLKDMRFIDMIKEGADGISDLSSGEETVQYCSRAPCMMGRNMFFRLRLHF